MKLCNKIFYKFGNKLDILKLEIKRFREDVYCLSFKEDSIIDEISNTLIRSENEYSVTIINMTDEGENSKRITYKYSEKDTHTILNCDIIFYEDNTWYIESIYFIKDKVYEVQVRMDDSDGNDLITYLHILTKFDRSGTNLNQVIEYFSIEELTELYKNSTLDEFVNTVLKKFEKYSNLTW